MWLEQYVWNFEEGTRLYAHEQATDDVEEKRWLWIEFNVILLQRNGLFLIRGVHVDSSSEQRSHYDIDSN